MRIQKIGWARARTLISTPNSVVMFVFVHLDSAKRNPNVSVDKKPTANHQIVHINRGPSISREQKSEILDHKLVRACDRRSIEHLEIVFRGDLKYQLSGTWGVFPYPTGVATGIE